LDCVICKKKIGFLQKKEKLNDNEYCHVDCWADSNQGKAYVLLVNARLKLRFSDNSDRYIIALKKVNEALKCNFYVIDLLSLKSMILGELGEHNNAINSGLEALNQFEQKYGKDYIINKIKEVHANKISQDWLIQNDTLVDLYGDTLAFVSVGYIKLKKYKEAIPYIKEELKIYPNHKPAKTRLKICKDKLRNS